MSVDSGKIEQTIIGRRFSRRKNFNDQSISISRDYARYDGRVKSILFIFALSLLAVPAHGANETSRSPIDAPIIGPPELFAKSDTIVPSPIQNMLIHAISLIGVKYRYGGGSLEGGFDCSGFVRHVFAEALLRDLPRSSFEMSKMGAAIDEDALMPGDLLFYNTLKRRFSHVAIYLGEGRFVHAPSRGKSVEIASMSDTYWKKRFNGARRLVDPVNP